jgi:hypothetical protein
MDSMEPVYRHMRRQHSSEVKVMWKAQVWRENVFRVVGRDGKL